MGKRIYYAVVDSLAVTFFLMMVCLFWLFVVMALHWEGIISVEPLMVVLNHIIDGALESFFHWLLK